MAFLRAVTCSFLFFSACTGFESSLEPAGDAGDAGDAGSTPMADGAADGSPSIDAADAGDTCRDRCEGADWIPCGAARVTCSLGCVESAGRAQCRSFDPEGPVTPADLRKSAGLADVVFGDAAMGTMVLDTDSGELTLIGQDAGTVVLRPPNADPNVEEASAGYSFRIDGDRAIVRAANLSLGKNLRLTGTHPLAWVALGEIAVTAEIRSPCGELGGGRPEIGSPQNGTQNNGCSGGGNATIGGKSTSAAGGAARLREVDQLLGGGAGATGAIAGGAGGSGGGSLQLVAGVRIRLGTGTGDVKGLNVGGCGGRGNIHGAPGGGGAGGTLVLEAPTIVGLVDGALISNGGGGGGNGNNGGDSRLDGAPAAGGTGPDLRWDPGQTVYSGSGGHRGHPNGGDSGGAWYGVGGGTPAGYSAGGGGVGFLVLRTRDGAVDFAPSAIVSPEPTFATLTPITQ